MTELHTAPLVSVIIPAYNEELHIQQCLESVLALDWPQECLEVIVVDNGSSDRTKGIAERLLALHGRSKVLYKPGGTIASVRNYGWLNTKGDTLCFLDGDCVVEPDWLKVGYDLLESAEDISCVGFMAAPPMSGASWVERNWFPISSSGKQKGTKEVRWLSSFNLLIRRSYLEQVGGFDESLVTCEDADLGNRLSQISRLLFSDKTHVKHLGSVKTIREFLGKEYWRGQNSLHSLLRNKDRTTELLSVFIPGAYLLLALLWLPILAAVFFCGSGFLWATGSSLLMLLLPVVLSLRAGLRNPIQVVSSSALYTLYLLARGVAIVRSQPWIIYHL